MNPVTSVRDLEPAASVFRSRSRSRSRSRRWRGLLWLVALAAAGGVLPASAQCEGESQLKLPRGFCASVFADGLGQPRHMAVQDNGDVYVMRRGAPTLALRDEDGDGRADRHATFGEYQGTGIAIYAGHLYLGHDGGVVRYRLSDTLVPPGPAEVIVEGLRAEGQHAAKALAFDDEGGLYVSIGAPSNACQQRTRAAGAPGLDPCPQREKNAGIWRFDAGRTNQRQDDGERYATGIRHAVAMSWRGGANRLYAMQHGRDQLHQLWPERYDAQQGRQLPAEELLAIDRGDDFGWPYCYFDPFKDARMLAPEYGGDGEQMARCEDFERPVAAFAAHMAPNGMLFYQGEAFPSRYRQGVFVAFHGSWNRSPRQKGYDVRFLPLTDDDRTGEAEVFASGFAGRELIRSPSQAEHRPVGLAQDVSGAILVSDDAGGYIWRIHYEDPQ